MQLKIPFRVVRGAWVVVFIIVAHLVIAWLFIKMRVRMPDMGPVFAMLLDDPREAPRNSAPTKSDLPVPPKANATPPPVQVSPSLAPAEDSSAEL